MKAYFETTIADPDNNSRSKKILLEGEWDGEMFISHNKYDKTTETIVRKKEWILFNKPKKYESILE